MYLAVSGSDRARRSRRSWRLARRARTPPRSRRTPRRPRGASASRRVGRVARARQDVGDRQAQVGVSGRRPRRAPLAVDAGELGDRRRDRRPAEAGRALVRLGEGPAGQEDGRDRQLVGRQAAEVVGEEGGLLGGPGRGGDALGQLAPAAHGGDGIPCLRWRSGRWFPESLDGTRVVLRRHVPENLAAFQRWYSDPEVARLARYQDGPMRPEEIERFFTARVVGPESLAMAIHVRATDRLIGTCAFSQLDGDNGSALYHITIGEKDAWGRGYGTEATRLMLDHAFGTLGPAPDRAVRVRVQRAGDPRVPALRLRRRGPGARGDLARRPLVGRARDERPRVRLARARGARRAARRAEPTPSRRRPGAASTSRPVGAGASGASAARPSGGWR